MKSKRQLKYKLQGDKPKLRPAPSPQLVQFEEAVRNRDLQTLVWLIDSGVVDVNQESAGGETAVMAAVAANNKQMTADELDSRHPDCRARIVPCGACGLGGIVAEHLDRHKADECKMRLVQCKYAPHGCMKHPLFAYEKNEHETMECRFRLVWCPMGCGQHVVANTVQTHPIKQCAACDSPRVPSAVASK
ncbi:hypothetical protein H257_17299 [Aphanomyces astaci]|uniref:TRAF-type domain-containing protein n=1 Tax=Aphanomyces astaci TaxID=112090 RepID=W4FFD0_APHAT|nr:hypothetical protein H257_17299 [Aphanomyces astaci]ETV66145.1 hypothetical protein H257_17299 [Aphanomyces astaci]|eukprot:XP_009844334.1 hypothetical protein H257_17299 [Aphanomyces astaci]